MNHALIVDDDQDTLMMLAELVSSHGFTEATAKSVRDARRSLAMQPPDAMFVDLMLPDGKGTDPSTIPLEYRSGLGHWAREPRNFNFRAAARSDRLSDQAGKPGAGESNSRASHSARRAESRCREPRGCAGTISARQIMAYHWPGNVRELRNGVQRAYVMADGAEVGDNWLGIETAPQAGAAIKVRIGTPLADVERALIMATLRLHGGARADCGPSASASRPSTTDSVRFKT